MRSCLLEKTFEKLFLFLFLAVQLVGQHLLALAMVFALGVADLLSLGVPSIVRVGSGLLSGSVPRLGAALSSLLAEFRSCARDLG